MTAGTLSQPIPNPFEATHPQQAYFAGKPANLTPYQWLFHPANLFGFPWWIRILLQKISSLSEETGHTYFGQKWLAKRFKRSIRWIREILRRLEKIGVIEVVRPPGRRNFYRLTAEFAAEFGGGDQAQNAGVTSGVETSVSLSDTKTCEEKSGGDNLDRNHVGKETQTTSSPAEPPKDDVDRIRSTFETLTGLKFNQERDGKTLVELLNTDINAVLTGMFRTVFNRTVSPNTVKPIRSLAYFVPEIAATKAEADQGKINLAEYLRYARSKTMALLKGKEKKE